MIIEFTENAVRVIRQICKDTNNMNTCNDYFEAIQKVRAIQTSVQTSVTTKQAGAFLKELIGIDSKTGIRNQFFHARTFIQHNLSGLPDFQTNEVNTGLNSASQTVYELVDILKEQVVSAFKESKYANEYLELVESTRQMVGRNLELPVNTIHDVTQLNDSIESASTHKRKLIRMINKIESEFGFTPRLVRSRITNTLKTLDNMTRAYERHKRQIIYRTESIPFFNSVRNEIKAGGKKTRRRLYSVYLSNSQKYNTRTIKK